MADASDFAGPVGSCQTGLAGCGDIQVPTGVRDPLDLSLAAFLQNIFHGRGAN